MRLNTQQAYVTITSLFCLVKYKYLLYNLLKYVAVYKSIKTNL